MIEHLCPNFSTVTQSRQRSLWLATMKLQQWLKKTQAIIQKQGKFTQCSFLKMTPTNYRKLEKYVGI